MAIQNKVLVDSKEMESAITTQYTCPANTVTIVDKFTATNVTGSAAVITVYFVPSGGAAGLTNKVIDAVTIGANSTEQLSASIGQGLEAGDFIATEGTASAVTIRCTGREVS